MPLKKLNQTAYLKSLQVNFREHPFEIYSNISVDKI